VSQCHSFYELGLEKIYLEANPDDRNHAHETAYNERLTAWIAHQRSMGKLPPPAQIVAAEQTRCSASQGRTDEVEEK